jgi:hypothetical protein
MTDILAIPVPAPTVTMMDVRSIFVAKDRKGGRLDIKDEDDQNLIKSIQRHGILQPIEVRTVANQDRYELVFGARRLAAAKYIGFEQIPVKIVDITDNQMATIIIEENLMRRQMTQPQYLTAFQKLWKAIEKEFGKDPGKAVGGQARARKASRSNGKFQEKPQIEPDPPATPAPGVAGETAESPPQEPGAHYHIAQEVTGRSESKTFEDIHIIKAFTPEQLAVIQTLDNVTRADMIKLAKLSRPDDPRMINCAIGEMGMGATCDEAIKSAQDAIRERDEEENGKAKAPRESELSDADWLSGYCYKVRHELQSTAAFDRDALLYRRTRDDRAVLKTRSREKTEKALRTGYSPFATMLERLIFVEHPDHWWICNECNGQNVDKPKCENCRGTGYRIKCEDRFTPKR